MISQLRQSIWRKSLRLRTRIVTPRAITATNSSVATTRSSGFDSLSFLPSRRWFSSPINVGDGPSPVVAKSTTENIYEDDEWTCLPSKPPKTAVKDNRTTNPSQVKKKDAGVDDDDDDGWTCLPSKPPSPNKRPSGSRSFSSAAPALGVAPQQKEQPLLLLDHWQVEIQANRLQADPQQERAAKKLQKLQLALHGYDNTPWIEHYEKRAEIRRQREQQLQQQEEAKMKQQQSTAALDGGESRYEAEENEAAPSLPPEPEPPQIRIPRGLYLYGSVGTGKSLLMDRFFDLVPVAEQKKRRCHFHAFMAEVHQRIHQLKLDDLENYGRNFHVDTNEYRNPIHRVGRQIAGETALLCFE